MKKLTLTLLTLLGSSVYGLPVNNPSEASLFLRSVKMESFCPDPCDPCFSWWDAWDIRAGFYGDYIFNRHMETKEGNRGGDIDKTEIYTNAGYIAFNICNRIDIFGTLGSTTLHIKTNARSWGFPGSLQSELFFSSEFSWSIGARATLWQCDCFSVGLEGQYFETSPDIKRFVEYENGQIVDFNSTHAVCYSEWQTGIGIAYRFSTCAPTVAFVPYAAVKWAGSRFDLDSFRFTQTIAGVSRNLIFLDLQSKKLWGYAIGISFTLCDMVGVNVEGRFSDEKAVAVNGQFRF